MTADLRQIVRRRLAGDVAAGISVVILGVAATFGSAGVVLGGNPPSVPPGQEKKATPTPPPIVTPAPIVPPAPTPATPDPIVTPAPTPATPAPTPATPAPIVTPAPTRATPAVSAQPPPPAGGGSGSSGSGAGGTGSTPGATPAPTPSAAAEASATPESSDAAVAAGSMVSGAAGSGGWTPVAAILIVAVLGVLTIIAGWFIVGRRSSRDDETAVAGMTPETVGSASIGAPAAPLPTIRFAGPHTEDPLLAAIKRSRDGRGSASRRPVQILGEDDGPDFKGPTWVRRLEPEIKVIPALTIEAERAREARRTGPGSGSRDDAAHARSA